MQLDEKYLVRVPNGKKHLLPLPRHGRFDGAPKKDGGLRKSGIFQTAVYYNSIFRTSAVSLSREYEFFNWVGLEYG
jgi:hypothetical protein